MSAPALCSIACLSKAVVQLSSGRYDCVIVRESACAQEGGLSELYAYSDRHDGRLKLGPVLQQIKTGLALTVRNNWDASSPPSKASLATGIVPSLEKEVSPSRH